MNKQELSILEKMLRDRDKKEKTLQKSTGDCVKGTVRAMSKKQADALRKLLEYYKNKQTVWIEQ